MKIHSEGLLPPDHVRDVFIMSNLPGVGDRILVPGLDWCIHLNRATHYSMVYSNPGCRHTLLVRSLCDRSVIRWAVPDDFTGFEQVVFWHGYKVLPDWWCEYKRKNRYKVPSTGFLAYHLAHEAAPDANIHLVGFRPGEDVGTRWKGHAWDYEAAYYEENNVDII